MKVLCEIIKSFSPYVKGDIICVEHDEFIKLKTYGIAVDKNVLCKEYKEEYIKEELKNCNIKGEKYIKNSVDVVVLTRGEVKTSFNLKDYGINTSEIITSDFVKTGKGFAENCNIGASMYQKLGEFILFLNDDVIINNKEQFIIDLLEPFKDKDVGIVGCECSKTNWGINGSVMCIRRELFEMIGGFDDDYFFMWEDNDICKQIEKRGYKLLISNAQATHKGKDSINTESEFWKKYFYEGKIRFENKFKDGRVIGSMTVGNENDRYLKEVVENLFKRKLIDCLIVVCDKSNDETVEELKELKKLYPIKIYYHDFKLFGKAENLLRERSIQYAMSQNPYGIIPIDADEKLDSTLTRDKIIELLNQNICWDLMVCHFWNDKQHVRTDGIFGHQKNARLYRVLWKESTKFYDKGLHCGSVPMYAYAQRKTCDYLFEHYGYIRKKDIEDKSKRQKQFDKNKMLENPDLYNRMIDDSKAEISLFNRDNFIKKWKI